MDGNKNRKVMPSGSGMPPSDGERECEGRTREEEAGPSKPKQKWRWCEAKEGGSQNRKAGNRRGKSG